MSEYLFAYGTLQPGCAPPQMADVAAKLRVVGKGFVRGVLYDLGRHPGAVAEATAESRISGTVMELPDDPEVLRQLDEYEGFDPRNREASEFVRERQMVELAAGGAVECWFYRYKGPAGPTQVIVTGLWRGSRRDTFG
jgi:gamma-glutamylcyclotransferase (GGCT)/AIG2-like uncharacterized protein YtfP